MALPPSGVNLFAPVSTAGLPLRIQQLEQEYQRLEQEHLSQVGTGDLDASRLEQMGKIHDELIRLRLASTGGIAAPAPPPIPLPAPISNGTPPPLWTPPSFSQASPSPSNWTQTQNTLPTGSGPPASSIVYNIPSPGAVNRATNKIPTPEYTLNRGDQVFNFGDYVQMAGQFLNGGTPEFERDRNNSHRLVGMGGGGIGGTGGGGGIGGTGGGGGNSGDMNFGSKLEIAGKALTGDMGAIFQVLKTQAEQLPRAFADMKKAFTSERFGEAGANVGGAIEKIGNFGMNFPVELMGKGLKTIMESIDALKKWSEQLHDSNMKFSEFSGAMANVAAQQEVRDIILSKQRGDRRAESANYLAEAKSRLAQETAPIEDAMANSRNWLAGYLDNKLADLINPLNKLLEKMGIITDKAEAADDFHGPEEGLTSWMDRVARDDHILKMGRPRRFKDKE